MDWCHIDIYIQLNFVSIAVGVLNGVCNIYVDRYRKPNTREQSESAEKEYRQINNIERFVTDLAMKLNIKVNYDEV